MNYEPQLSDLLKSVSLTDTQQRNLRDAHIRLRERLMADEALKPVIVGTFLQGSYRRHTGIRPEGNDKPDVDVVVVTRLDRRDYTPGAAMNVLKPFLNRHYQGRWKEKGRSIGIEMSNVKLDVVLTSAPSEVAERAFLEFLQQDNAGGVSFDSGSDWKEAPLWIPDREARNWQRTNPLEQIRWTQEKNARTNGYYIHVVKLVKSWWQTRHPEQDHPRSYPLEHIVGDCCPDGVNTLAEAFAATMAEIARRYPPGIPAHSSDRGVTEQNVLKRVTAADMNAFRSKVTAGAALAAQAVSSQSRSEGADLWRKIFGRRFPVGKDRSGFTAREQPGQIRGGRFG